MKKKNKIQIRNSASEFLIFTRQSGDDGIEVRVEDETVWLTQKLMAALFEVTVPTINEHLANLYSQGEIVEGSTIRKFRTVQKEGEREVARNVDFYNLDAIIVDAEITKTFFAVVQNKLHFAIHRHTAAELIVKRADSKKEKMGLTTWKNAPYGKIIKPDVSVAKNYLTEKELKSLDRFVTMYLDYAEDQTERNIPMTMKDWAGKLNAFLQFNERDILDNPGKVSQEVAKAFAESEFEKYRIVQDRLFESDFDRHMKKTLEDRKKQQMDSM